VGSEKKERAGKLSMASTVIRKKKKKKNKKKKKKKKQKKKPPPKREGVRGVFSSLDHEKRGENDHSEPCRPGRKKKNRGSAMSGVKGKQGRRFPPTSFLPFFFR